MNPRINELAALPRGKAWHSRLNRHEEDIRRLRRAGESYRAIACWLAERGLPVSASAVHGFVRARARRGRGQYALPEATKAGMTEARGDDPSNPSSLGHHQDTSGENPAKTSKTFTFTPKQRPSHFTDEDLQLNDPLA